MLDVEKIKKDFPILERKIDGQRLVYLDNAATSQKPAQVIGAIKEYYERYNANVHRSPHTLGEEATIAYEEARKAVADFINAKPEEIIFTRNASEALNLVMYAYGMNEIRKGGKIAVSVMEHHSNFVPWQQLAKKKNAEFEVLDINKEGEITEEEYAKLKNVKIAAFAHASNVLGTINDLGKIAKIVHQEGGVLVGDGAQSVPHMPVDVKKMDVDFFAFSGHKMLAPMGIGVLYGKAELLGKMEPFIYGGEMISEVHVKETKFKEPPYKYEAGTPNVEGAIGLRVAMDYLKKLGMENVRKHEMELTAYALEKIGAIGKISILGPKKAEKRTGLVAFNLGNLHPHDVAQMLDSYGIAIRAGHHCAQPLHERLGIFSSARASFYVYNDERDADALCEGLENVKKRFGV